jgi:small GTP-binding protein
MSEPCRFVLIGHVDFGKSTLAGRLLYEAGAFSEHEVEKTAQEAEKLKMSKWKWAFLLDVNEEERVKGKTHEYTVIPFEWKEKEYELIDTPGHQSFVRSTIKGIGSYPNVHAILVVSAIENEFSSGFERGMLKEQVLLARASGVTRLIVAVNKMDAVGWDVQVAKKIQDTLTAFLRPLKFKETHFIPVSAYEGTGLTDILEVLSKFETAEPSKKEAIYRPASDIWTVRCRILSCENIITAGYGCMAHLDGEEYEVQVEKLHGQRFLKSGDTCNIVLHFTEKVLPESGRIILRNNENTIGFGLIV